MQITPDWARLFECAAVKLRSGPMRLDWSWVFIPEPNARIHPVDAFTRHSNAESKSFLSDFRVSYIAECPL